MSVSGPYRTCCSLLGGSLENLTLAAGLDRSRSRLAARNLSRSFDGPSARRRGTENGHDDDGRADGGGGGGGRDFDDDGDAAFASPSRRSTGAADDTVFDDDDDDGEEDNDEDDDDGGGGCGGSPDSSCSQHSGTPSRKGRWPNRKNLSLSFTSASHGNGDGDGADDANGADDAGVAARVEHVDVVGSNVSMADVSDRRATSSLVAKGLCQTDSGFNDMEVCERG